MDVYFITFVVLLTLSAQISLEVRPEKEESYYYYEPAYIYQPPTKSTQAHSSSKKYLDETVPEMIKLPENSNISSEQFYKKLSDQLGKSDMTNALNTDQSPLSKYSEPLHMIGDKLLDDPLRELLGKAITSRIIIPAAVKELYLRVWFQLD